VSKAKLTIITATAGAAKSPECFQSWYTRRSGPVAIVTIHQGSAVPYPQPCRSQDVSVTADFDDYLGPVPAFKLGVDLALQITDPSGIIACLHDDLLIEEDGWDQTVLAYFAQHPEVGLAGFGGGTGLGSDDIYQAPYDPMQLARQGFVSNMRDAEAHGRRSTVPVKVAALDGFSQVGRVAYWQGNATAKHLPATAPFDVLVHHGVIHHAYDSFLGAWAARLGWQVAMIPIACHHYGGQTAVADAGYQQWANEHTHVENGDHSLWLTAHHAVYQLLRGVLPLRV